MTRDDIIRMAREADIDWHKHWDDDENRLERFAALVAADEREECAKIADVNEYQRANARWALLGGVEGIELLDDLAIAIRARGTHEA